MKILKKNLSLLVFVGLFGIGLAACEKKEDPFKPSPAPSGGSNVTGPPASYVSLKYKLNGRDTSWNAETFSYKTYNKDTDSAYSILSAQKLTIKLPAIEGYYSLGKTNGLNKFWAHWDGGNSESGELRVSFIDKMNKKVNGVFSFKVGSLEIYDGKFVNVPEVK